MAQKKQELPGWFPFAVVSSFLVMIAAGMKSNWTLAADRKPEPPDPKQPPPVTQAGVLRDWYANDFF